MMQDTPSIAVIGMSCRFPGADTPAEFWDNLRKGIDSISRFSMEELAASGADLDAARDPRYIPARAVLANGSSFDAAFFGCSPREAEIMDPQHRVFLECSWEAMEDAGYAPGKTDARVGVFAGAGTNTYLFRNIIGNREISRSVDGFQIFLGNDKDFIPTRVSYKLNLRGPSFAVTTACSSSLVAVHVACQSLLGFQCDMALAGAVSIHSPEKEGYLYQEGGIHSPDGRCRAFDAEAAGTVGGSGCGVVLLKRLEDALADGDTIHAVIRGSAINNDGSGKVGYTAPSVEGQAEVIAEAHAVAGVNPESISYIEAHGTGTVLGDPIEIEALTRAFRRHTNRREFCAIGSTKTNIGHLDAAAGMAGLIKTILALKHRALPATLHFKTPNPRIQWTESPFYVNAQLTPWNSSVEPLRAGVSSFGIGGTNAHVVLEEAPTKPSTSSDRPHHLIPLSARTPEALARYAERIATALEDDTHPLEDVAYTLQMGRSVFPYRAAIVSESAQTASKLLRQLKPVTEPVRERPVAFLFPGQGAQQPFMFADLYRTEPVFRETLDRCSRILEPNLGFDLRRIVYPTESSREEAAATLERTEFAQPAIFAVEYALAALLASLDIRPAAMLGHSLGEYTAACLAGVFSLESALDIVATRGKLMSRLPRGAMLAIPLAPDEIKPWLTDGIAIAATNGPARSVVSGSHAAIAELNDSLTQQGFSCKLLQTSHAFHSSTMDPILDEFADTMRRAVLQEPRTPYISNLTGTWITPKQATDPEYWTQHLRHTVRFGEGLTSLLSDARVALVQVGPGRELLSMARRQPGCGADRPVLSSDPFADLVAQLWAAGVPLNWQGLHAGETCRRASLPTYPFERQRYYVQPGRSIERSTPTLSNDPLEWLYTPSWTRSILPPSPNHDAGPWLIFADKHELSDELIACLGQREVTVVTAGDAFIRTAPGKFTINASTPEHYGRLLAELSSPPRRIVHLWSAAQGNSLEHGFYSVFHLMRAIGEKGSAGVRIDLISRGLYDVTGEEALEPFQATLLAFVRVAPQEYPDLQCRIVDVSLPSSQGLRELAGRIVTELDSAAADSVVALRGRHRWVQSIAPLAVSSDQPSLLERRKTYLITGGTSGLGLEFAKHLVSTKDANLVLVSRSLSKNARTAARTSNAFDLLPSKIVEREQRIERDLAIRRLSSYAGLEESLNRLCVAHIFAYLREKGAMLGAGDKIDCAELMHRLGVLPKFERFVDYFLSVLCEGGYARIDGSTITFPEIPQENASELSAAIQAQHPGFRPTIALLDHCGTHYSRALSGEMEAISVLFPDGKSGLMLEAGRDTVEHLNSRVYRVLLKELLAEAISRSDGKKIRILEIGAGNGVLTGELLSVLSAANVEYHFTDLGKSFVLTAEARAAERGLNFMQFGVLDIAAPPETQGYTSESFDFVFGLDVVHATPNIAKTLTNLRRFLKPGGSIALIETLGVARWNHMIFGLTEGWWNFEDPEVRVNGTPVLNLENWRRLLDSTGFTNVASYPTDSGAKSDSGLLLASNPASSISHDFSAIGGNVLALQCDITDAEKMEDVVSQALQRFGGIDGIFHCAAVDDQGSIQWKTPRFDEMEFAPKIHGTQVLLRIAERTNAEFLLLCSSLNTITGGAGQVGYCAANAYLDAIANQQVQNRTKVISVNWDRWQGIGMAADFEEWHQRMTGEPLLGGMTVKQGLAILDHVLRTDTPPQVIVSKTSLNSAVRRHNVKQAPAIQSQAPAPRVSVTTGKQPPVGPIEVAIASVFAETLGVAEVGRNDNFAELGGDSLIAIQVVSRLRETLRVELPLRSIFESPTVADLAERVANHQWAADSQTAVVTSAEMEEGVL